MAFLSHLSPNKIKIAPTTRRSTSSGTHCTSATPNIPTSATKISSAAPVPTSALRQLIVTPTTSTIVNASTHSTNDAANAEVKTIHSMTSSFFMYVVFRPAGRKQHTEDKKSVHLDQLYYG